MWSNRRQRDDHPHDLQRSHGRASDSTRDRQDIDPYPRLSVNDRGLDEGYIYRDDPPSTEGYQLNVRDIDSRRGYTYDRDNLDTGHDSVWQNSRNGLRDTLDINQFTSRGDEHVGEFRTGRDSFEDRDLGRPVNLYSEYNNKEPDRVRDYDNFNESATGKRQDIGFQYEHLDRVRDDRKPNSGERRFREPKATHRGGLNAKNSQTYRNNSGVGDQRTLNVRNQTSSYEANIERGPRRRQTYDNKSSVHTKTNNQRQSPRESKSSQNHTLSHDKRKERSGEAHSSHSRRSTSQGGRSGSKSAPSRAKSDDHRKSSSKNTSHSYGHSHANKGKTATVPPEKSSASNSSQSQRKQDYRREETTSRHNDRNKDSFKKPKDIHKSRNESDVKIESDHLFSSYHEDDILSIMAEDDVFDRDTKRGIGSESFSRHRSHEKDNRPNDSRKSSRDRQQDRTKPREQSRVSSDNKKHNEQSRSYTNRGKTTGRGVQRHDNVVRKNSQRSESRTQVFASKLKKKTLQGFRKNDSFRNGRSFNNFDRNRNSGPKKYPRTSRSIGGKSDSVKNTTARNMSIGSNLGTGNDNTVFKDHRRTDKSFEAKTMESGFGRGRGAHTVMERGRFGAILKDDRSVDASDRVNKIGSLHRNVNDNKTPYTRDFQNVGKFNKTNDRYQCQMGKFEKPFHKAGKSVAVQKRESIKKRYDRVRNRMNSRRFNEKQAETHMERNIHFIEQKTDIEDRRMIMNDGDPVVDGSQPIYFIPNGDMAGAQPQFVDAMGNLVMNPGIPAGDNLQLIPQGMPIPEGVPGEQQQLVFIPFPHPHMPGMPDTMMSPPPDFGRDMKETLTTTDHTTTAVIKEYPKSKPDEKKKPLSKQQRMLIRRNLQRKRRQALEQKIEKKILNKLMGNVNLSAVRNTEGLAASKRKPVIKRISPPGETSHINKKVKLVRRAAERREELDDVSDEYDNVSEYEDISDMEDVSDDETDEHFGRERRGVRQSSKKTVFRKPGEPRQKRLQVVSGDVRRVVSQTAGKGSSVARSKVIEGRKRQVVKSEHKPNYIKKRRSISPIEITVSNIRKQDNRVYKASSQEEVRSRYQDDEEDHRRHSYGKPNAGQRSRTDRKSNRDNNVGINRRNTPEDRRNDKDKYEEEADRKQFRDQSRDRIPADQSGRRQQSDDRDVRNRSTADDSQVQFDRGNRRTKQFVDDVNDELVGQNQYSVNLSRGNKYSRLPSHSFAVQNQPPVVIYSNSDVDYSLPPQQMPPMSTQMAPTIIQNSPDMSMPPPIVAGTQTSMSQIIGQPQQNIQNFNTTRFPQQQFQPQYQQQAVIQQQGNSQPMRVIHQSLGQQQTMIAGHQVQNSAGLEYTGIQQNMNQAQLIGNQVSTSTMMGGIQQAVQAPQNQPYTTRAVHQPNTTRAVHQSNTTRTRANGYVRNFSNQEVLETRSPRNNTAFTSAGETVDNRGFGKGVDNRGFGKGVDMYQQTEGRGRVSRFSGHSYQDESREHTDNYDDEELVELLCSKCDRVFLDDEAMRKHKDWHDKVSMGDNQLRCNLCEQAFPNSSQNQIHCQEKHTIDSWNCTLCDKTFHGASQLEQHLQTMNHQSTKLLYNCSVCPANFQSLKFLIQHKRDHHAGPGMAGNLW